MEILLPMYEQAKVEENKAIPTITVIDKAYPPTQKYYPKLSLIILAGAFISFFISILLAINATNILSSKVEDSEFEQKIKNFYSKIIKIYKIQ